MFKRKAKPAKILRIDTLIGAGTVIEGDVRFKGGLHVDGVIKGQVIALPDVASSLSISNSGLIEGLVRVPNVVLNGSINGDIVASERVELGATAKVSGNVHYGLIEIAMGAQINGKLLPQSVAKGVTAETNAGPAEPVGPVAAELG